MSLLDWKEFYKLYMRARYVEATMEQWISAVKLLAKIHEGRAAEETIDTSITDLTEIEKEAIPVLEQLRAIRVWPDGLITLRSWGIRTGELICDFIKKTK